MRIPPLPAAMLPLALTLVAAPALAQSLPNSLNMSCAATANLVQQRGAVVIATGPNVYDRYVSNQGYCDVDQTTYPVWLQTADQNQCFIGYRCRERLLHSR